MANISIKNHIPFDKIFCYLHPFRLNAYHECHKTQMSTIYHSRHCLLPIMCYFTKRLSDCSNNTI